MTKAKYTNPIKALGFGMLYHAQTRDNRITDGAYRTYAMMLEYAQQKEKAWPSRETVADIRGKSPRTITNHYNELIKARYIKRDRRMDTTSITWILDAEGNKHLLKLSESILEERQNKAVSETNCTTNVKLVSPRTCNKLHEEEEPTKKNKEKEQVKEKGTTVPRPELSLMVDCLSAVTGMDKKLNYGRLAKEGKAIIQAGYTPTQLTAVYGSNGAWYKRNWKGKKGDRPSTADIRNSIAELLRKPTGKNGKEDDRHKYKKGKYAKHVN